MTKSKSVSTPRVREWIVRVQRKRVVVRAWITRTKGGGTAEIDDIVETLHQYHFANWPSQMLCDHLIELDDRINAIEVLRPDGIGALAYRNWP